MGQTTERKTLQDYNFKGGLGDINPAELEPQAIEKYKSTLNDQIKALEERYNEPNLYKVAAGFAKPQLGGFLASLGSAAEAMGENFEAKREQMLPIAQMKMQVEQANMLLGQKQKQNDIYQEWLKKNTNPDGTVKPMDATTYSRIMSLGDKTEVANAATKYYEGAKAGLDITVGAAEAASKLPQLGTSLDGYTKFQLNPNADEKAFNTSRSEYLKNLEASKPPQMQQSEWNSLGLADKQAAVNAYGRSQIEAGMNTEAGMQKMAQQAPERLALLGSIRDLALGMGLESTTTKDGKTLTGQQQMAALLNYFGGNNPMEVLARAAADGKLGEKLQDIDNYARQHQMTPAARDHFQKLAKLLAENQVTLRNGAVNPTDQFSSLQRAGSPNVGNTQTALVTLVDLMGHGEKNSIDKYRYVLDNKVPFRELGVDEGYLEKQREYAAEHRRIARENPLAGNPSWYNPAGGSTPSAGGGGGGGGQNKPQQRSNRMKGMNGNWWTRDEKTGAWKDTGEKAQ